MFCLCIAKASKHTPLGPKKPTLELSADMSEDMSADASADALGRIS